MPLLLGVCVCGCVWVCVEEAALNMVSLRWNLGGPKYSSACFSRIGAPEETKRNFAGNFANPSGSNVPGVRRATPTAALPANEHGRVKRREPRSGCVRFGVGTLPWLFERRAKGRTTSLRGPDFDAYRFCHAVFLSAEKCSL